MSQSHEEWVPGDYCIFWLFVSDEQYNRSPEKCQELAAEGAKIASSPKEVAENSDVVFSIVG